MMDAVGTKKQAGGTGSLFTKYFLFRLRKDMLRTLIFCALGILITMSVAQNTAIVYSRYLEYENVWESKYSATSIYIVTTVMGIAASVIPILDHLAFKNRRNIDTLFSLPLSRRRMALAVYLSGLVEAFAIYLCSFLTILLYYLPYAEHMELVYFIPYFFTILLLGIAVYTIMSYIMTEGNTVLDSILFCALWTYVLQFLTLALYYSSIAGREWIGNETVAILDGLPECLNLYSPLNNMTVLFQGLIGYPTRPMDIAWLWFTCIVWMVAGVGSFWGYLRNMTQKGAEKVGETSTSWLGYRFLIPAYGYSGLLLCYGYIPGIVIIFSLMLAAYFCYRRSFRIKVADVITLGGGVLLLILRRVIDLLAR